MPFFIPRTMSARSCFSKWIRSSGRQTSSFRRRTSTSSGMPAVAHHGLRASSRGVIPTRLDCAGVFGGGMLGSMTSSVEFAVVSPVAVSESAFLSAECSSPSEDDGPVREGNSSVDSLELSRSATEKPFSGSMCRSSCPSPVVFPLVLPSSLWSYAADSPERMTSRPHSRRQRRTMPSMPPPSAAASTNHSARARRCTAFVMFRSAKIWGSSTTWPKGSMISA
mmetsp:Transcript_9890/g.22138  ORF Transcript_9890/g.22138 Transcript_9890/m.22138 type:complete len:223 (+) Transcript_9890:214-882(+)